MAGNPFRKAQAAPPGVAVSREAAADLGLDTSDSTIKPKKVVKRVRIQSPVISPDEPHADPFDARLNDEGHSGSPPPPDQDPDIAIQLRKSFIDSVASGASNLNREVVGDVPPQSHNVGLGTDAMASRAALPQQAPYNPFAKTLASMEGGYGLVPPPFLSEGKSAETTTSGQTREDGRATPKASMDVDSFTRMLLTGTPVPTAPTSQASSTPILQPPSTTGLYTDGTSTANSSTSRQSLFEPILHAESPRSSYEHSRSDEEMDVNEQTSLVGGSRSKKAKPPPPAHHRGKLLSSKKGPQTVSFADFETSLDQQSGSSSSAPSIQSLPPPGPSRSQSDLNKPLPLPPSSGRSAPGAEVVEKTIVNPLASLPLPASSQLDEPQTTMLRPPPPPVSRRTSQSKTDGPTGRARSSSTLSRSSIPDDYTGTTTASPMTASPQLQPSKPPPPPSRRAANSVSSVDRETSLSRSIPESIEPSIQSSHPRAPPPPPSRQTLRGGPTLTRTPSTQSTSSLGHRRISSGISQAPPPPPPRRGEKRSSFDGAHLGPSARRPSDGGSQRSSIELRRSSGASLNNPQTPSISSLQHVPEGESGQDVSTAESSHDQNHGTNILADLSAFQAEIDALRAQIGK